MGRNINAIDKGFIFEAEAIAYEKPILEYANHEPANPATAAPTTVDHRPANPAYRKHGREIISARPGKSPVNIYRFNESEGDSCGKCERNHALLIDLNPIVEKHGIHSRLIIPCDIDRRDIERNKR